MTDQEAFWRNQFAAEYRERNREFDKELGVEAWKAMLRNAEPIGSLLECGSNIGRNVGFLEAALPTAKKSIIEISPEAYNIVSGTYPLEHSFNGSILASDLPKDHFDLVFTCGVLIHVDPAQLVANMAKMLGYSRKYVLIAEYFNRTPIMLEYHGQTKKLFKCDFGKLFLEHFPVEVVDYGFLWGQIYDPAGFDDVTWWLFEKRP